MAVASSLAAQDLAHPASANALDALNAAIETLTTTVAPSVVQVQVTGYRAVDDASRGDAGLVFGRQRTIGSGVVVDADGDIVTNAHVVMGAQQVRVVLSGASRTGGPLQSLAFASGTTVPARVVGVADDIDLALLKVDVPNLRPLKFANYDEIRQGELVFAFGSPDGLRNSVTMGVVSSVARQIDPDSASVYVQTDAPINPGNSGGPLVNVKGELVGLNTFIISESGGSQGMGFAIPSIVMTSTIPQLRKYGHLRRGTVGISVQAITPPLADGLRLPRTFGVVVSDVEPDSPADVAGVEEQDIITAVDGRPVDSVPVLMLALSTRTIGDRVILALLRGDRALNVPVYVGERPQAIDELIERTDPDKNAVPALSIVGLDLDEEATKVLPALRRQAGVLVTARRLEADPDNPLRAGDVIHGLNAFTISSLDGLRALLQGHKPDTEIVLQVERDHRLMFVTMVIH